MKERNRHTGRINAAKARIIAQGERVRASGGTVYARVPTRSMRGSPIAYTYVRLFA